MAPKIDFKKHKKFKIAKSKKVMRIIWRGFRTKNFLAKKKA